MNKIKYIIKTIVISIELFVFLVPVALWIFGIRNPFEKVSSIFFDVIDIEHIVFQFALPITMITLTYNHIKDILAPDMNLKKFYCWNDYEKLKNTLLVGIGWNALCIVVVIIILMQLIDFKHGIKGVLYVSACISSTFSTVSVIFAKHKIKEIVELNKE